MSLTKALPLVFVVVSAAAASSPKRSVDITGTYASNWDDVSLVQEGKRVRGTYVCCGGGTIEGRILEGSVIRYTWRQPGGQGEGIWKITPGGTLDGTWGWNQSDSDGGRWVLEPKNSSGQIAN